jgi:hypothetical protein
MAANDALAELPQTMPQEEPVVLDYIEETIQTSDDPQVEEIIGDLGFILSEHIQRANAAIRELKGDRFWLTASIDTTLVEVEPDVENR